MKVGNRPEATGNSKNPTALGFALCALLLALCASAEAQQPKKVPRIGVLVNGTPSSHKFTIDEFQQGLHDLGLVEGQNFLLEVRYAEGKLDRLPDLAQELAQMNVEVILTAATPGTVAMKKTTNTIPLFSPAWATR